MLTRVDEPSLVIVREGQMPRGSPSLTLMLFSAVAALLLGRSAFAQDESQQVLTIDHYIDQVSTVPAIAGQPVKLYVRERVQADTTLDGTSAEGKVILFVHGSNSPSEVAFDLFYQDYSWMALFARAGLDAFGVSLTGFGWSTRPAPMNDPCNANPDQQKLLIPSVIAETCAPSYPRVLYSYEPGFDDIDRTVDHLRDLRKVDRVSLVAWSAGGEWAGGYAALHPEKVDKLVLLAPAYDRQLADGPAGTSGLPMNVLSRANYFAQWNQQTQCPDQVDPSVPDAEWAAALESDPTGAGWGAGVLRSPMKAPYGWASLAATVQAPTLLISGELDKSVAPQAVRDLYADLGTQNKVFLEMACTSHYSPWETRHAIEQQTSLDWLLNGSVNGMTEGSLRLGD